MPKTHCGKHNKLSKTMGVIIGLNGRNNKFTVPCIPIGCFWCLLNSDYTSSCVTGDRKLYVFVQVL